MCFFEMLVFDTVSSELPLVSNGKSLNFQIKNAFFYLDLTGEPGKVLVGINKCSFVGLGLL